MSLRFIYGRAGSGKSHFCLDDMESKLGSDGSSRFILLVPEQFSLQADKNMIKFLGATGIMKADVLTFRRMAYRVFNEVGGVTRRYINSAGKCMILYRLMEGMKDKLKAFSKAAGQQGFINTLSGSIAEFKRYNITPDFIKEISSGISDNELLKNKLEDIGTIFQEFERHLEGIYMDTDDDLTALSNKLDKSTLFDGAEIWIDEFSGFTPQEYKVIEMLLLKTRRINICLCTDCLPDGIEIDGTDVFSPAKKAAAKLMTIAKEKGIKIDAPVALTREPFYRFRDSRELSHLERSYYNYTYRPYTDKTQDISIFTAVNIYSEVENAAREIIGLCRDKGMRYRDMAVVARNLPAYDKLISSVFTQYGIPFFIDQKRNINDHPLVMLILSIMEIFGRGWSYEAVFRYLKTGLTNVAVEEVDILENYVLACGIKGSRWTQEEPWSYRIAAPFGDSPMTAYEMDILERVNSIKEKVSQPLLNFRSKLRGRKNAREICSALFQLLCDIEVPGNIEKCIDELKAAGELNGANQYSQVWNIVMGVFDQVVEVMGDENVTLEKLGEILAIGFSEYKVGVIPPALDQVLVGSVERSKSHEISALFILGVNDGILPSAFSEEGLLSDRDRESLRAKGMEIAQDSRTKAFEEQYLVYTALTTAGRYLKLSYPIADHEGKTLRPSRVISRLKQVFSSISEHSNIAPAGSDEESLGLVASPSPTFNELVSAVRKRLEGAPVNSIWWDVYRWYLRDERWANMSRTAFGGLVYSNAPGAVNQEKTRKLYGSNVYSSVSRLEKYASCPFSYYVQYGLKAKDRKIFKLSAPDLGTFMHTVIDRFSRLLVESSISWRTLEREWCSAAVSSIVDELLESMSGSIFNSSRRYRHLALRLKRVLSRAIWIIAEHIKRGSFEPIGYEMAFGENEAFPPITLELSNGDKVSLTGRIDRVDALKTEEGTYLRIVDYKSGSKAFKLSDVYYGLQLQLITYMNAVWENGGEGIEKPVLPGGILYFKVDDPIIRGGSGTTEEDIEKAIMKQLKMRGLLLGDVKLIKEMDRHIDGDSMIIPARINKGDILGKSSAASSEQFEMLRGYVRKLLLRMCEEMLKGEVSMRPYKKKRITSCMYCSYASVCQFDPRLSDNNYRILNDRKDDEVWELIKSEGGLK